jgi:quinol monooxygenase YgiN
MVVRRKRIMITRMIIVTVPKERSAEAEGIWKHECAPIMIQQPGCLGEQFLRNRENPGELISLQTWQDQKSIDQYRSGPGHVQILGHTRGLMGVSKVEVKNYEVVG